MNNQTAFLTLGKSVVRFDVPNENEEVTSGVKWGNVIAFPTVAYWLYTIMCKRLENQSIQYKLGKTLHEEVGACLLGGHGIPAAIGLAAYEQLKEKGAFSGEVHSEETLYQWLSEPINTGQKQVKYRFAKQKAAYLHNALKKLDTEDAPTETGIALRDWLTEVKGIGLKTASWIARNWLDADDVAILDIHIYRAGILGGFFDENMTVEKHYKELEVAFVQLAAAMDVRTSELDAVIWFEMQQSPSVLDLLKSRNQPEEPKLRKLSQRRKTHTEQLSLV